MKMNDSSLFYRQVKCRADKMALWVELPAVEPGRPPEFGPKVTHNGRREKTPVSRPLTCTHMQCRVHSDTHTHI